jgi:divinyl chlorophyllide a 8-vinyl-reductase
MTTPPAHGPDDAVLHGERHKVLVAGATGYIGRFVVAELVRRGHEVVSLARPRAGIDGQLTPERVRAGLPGSEVRFGEITDRDWLAREGIAGEPFDAVISCIASRTGGIADAWRIDYQANHDLLEAARAAGVRQFVLLSAICVQKPRLAFQCAKRAFETELADSGLTWSIVRPTAFYKSIAGQVPRVREGKPFLLFGRGEGPACKPISERDTAAFIADCLADTDKQDRVLPIGGPDAAITARGRGELLFELSGQPPAFRHIPLALFDTLVPVLSAGARVFPRLADKAEFARIGRYYATEPMLWMDPETGAYDAERTPSYGRDTLRDFYARVLDEGLAGQELGDQALF